MLEILHSESGEPVARWQGLMLASLRQPVNEAQKWVAHNEALIQACEHLIVLGLGCGYHVFELQKQYPSKKIFVIEVSEELVQFCEQHFSLQIAEVEVIQIDSLHKLIGSARIQKALSQPYSIIEHKASVQPHRGFYKEIAALLKGRERNVFREHLQLRNSRQMLFDEKTMLSELMKEEHSQHLISIKDLNNWLKPDQRWTRSGCLIQALRELVK
jgi:hypothetical protein